MTLRIARLLAALLPLLFAPDGRSQTHQSEAIGYVKAVQGVVRLVRLAGVEGRASGKLSSKDVLMPVMDTDDFAVEGDASTLTVKFFSEKKPTQFDAKTSYRAPKARFTPDRAHPGLFAIKTKRAGSSRKDPAGIVSPRDGSIVLADRVNLRWNAVDGPVTITVVGPDGKELFRREADGDALGIDSVFLQSTLARRVKEDTAVGLKVVLTWSKGKRSSGFRLLSSRTAKDVVDQLGECEKLDEPDRTLARIQVFDANGLLNSAADAAVSLWEAMPQSMAALTTAQYFADQIGDDALTETLDLCETRLIDAGNEQPGRLDIGAVMRIGREVSQAQENAARGWTAKSRAEFQRVLADCAGDNAVVDFLRSVAQMHIAVNEPEPMANAIMILRAAADGIDRANAARATDLVMNQAMKAADQGLSSDKGWACDLNSVSILLRIFAEQSNEGSSPDYENLVTRLRAMKEAVDRAGPAVQAYYYHQLASDLLALGKPTEAWDDSRAGFEAISNNENNPNYVRSFSCLMCFRILSLMGSKYWSEAARYLNMCTGFDPTVTSRPFVANFIDQMNKTAQPADPTPVDVPDTLARPEGADRAIVIGTSTYGPGWKELKNAGPEAVAVAKELESRFGFTTRLLLDSNRQAVNDALIEELGHLKKGRQLLIYVAGHGGTTPVSGPYLAFTDSPPPSDRYDPVHNFYLSGLATMMSLRPSGQVLLVLDTCYSAKLVDSVRSLFDTGPLRSDIKDAVSVGEILSEPCNLFICAGIDVSEGPPGDMSPFGKAFLDALRDKPSGRGFWKLSDVFSGILDAHKHNRLPSEPVEGSFGRGKGGFVFVPKKA